MATLYGDEEAGEGLYLVLELVEGEGLDEMLARGALPLDEALGLGSQVAAGLVVSGLTAFPLEMETRWLAAAMGIAPESRPEQLSGLARWVAAVRDGVAETNARNWRTVTSVFPIRSGLLRRTT